jgi:single-strand DNA-binding protein
MEFNMSNDLNQCQFIGRLGKDVEMRFTPEGSAVANFSLACGWESRSKDGNKKEGTEWINVAVYGKMAEVCSEYLSKGSQVFVQGRLRTEKWQDKVTGADRYSTRVNADKVQFLGSKSTSNNEPSNQGAGSPMPDDGGFDSMPDDIPF